MTKDSHLMFEKYVEALKSKLVNEAAAVPGAAVTTPTQTNSKQMEDQANSKRIVELLDMLKSDANLATQLALSPEEFVGFIEWAKSKFGGSSTMGESVVSEKKKAKDEDNMEVVKPSSEETEEEYLARRDAAIKASIAAKEESEEQAAMDSHYNVNHEALDLVHHLINHPKKYNKADAIKILALASDKLQNRA